jgi:hypothetical protein
MSAGYQILNLTRTLYHGSTVAIKEFDVVSGDGRYGRGLYLTPDRSMAEFYARGGRQGNSGQKLGQPGHVYEVKISGKCLKVLDEEETMRDVVDSVEQAEEAWRSIGDLTAAKVTKYLGEWASGDHGVAMIWMAEEGGVLTPVQQVLVMEKSAIKSVQMISSVKSSFDNPIVLRQLEQDLIPEIGELVLAAAFQPLSRYNLKTDRIFGARNSTKERFKIIELAGNRVVYKKLDTNKVEIEKVDDLLARWNNLGYGEITHWDEILETIKKHLTPFLGSVLVAGLISWLLGKLGK